MVFLELPFHRAVEQFHIGIRKGREWRVNRDHTPSGGSPSGQGACRVRRSSGSGCSLQKSSAVDGTIHDEVLSNKDILRANVFWKSGLRPSRRLVNLFQPGLDNPIELT